MASKSLLPRLNNPTKDLTRSEVFMPCDTGIWVSITRFTCAASQQRPISANPEFEVNFRFLL